MDYLHQYPDITLCITLVTWSSSAKQIPLTFFLPKDWYSAAAWSILSKNLNKHDNFMQNAPIYIMCLTIKNIMTYAAKCKTGGIFMTVQGACPIRVTLIELGHPHPPKGTPPYTDTSIVKGILTSYLRQHLSKTFDMRFYWVRDQIKQKPFYLVWRKVKTNKAD